MTAFEGINNTTDNEERVVRAYMRLVQAFFCCSRLNTKGKGQNAFYIRFMPLPRVSLKPSIYNLTRSLHTLSYICC